MEEIISKKELDELTQIKGEFIGVGLKNYFEFILKEEGKRGLERLENAMVGAGFPINYKDVKTREFYPLKIEVILLVLCKKLFNYNENEFQEMGRFQARSSLVIRFFARYFVSVNRAAQSVSKMWDRYFTTGKLKLVEYNEGKRYGILRLENYDIHPLICQTRVGYFSTILQIVLGKKGNCQETKCTHKGDKYHEFLLTW